jgi:hypothetical protein
MRSSRLLHALPAALAMVGLAWAVASCADFHRGPAPAPVDGGGDTNATGAVSDLMFEAQVYPILLMRCAGCHAEWQEAGLSKLLFTGNARQDRAMVLALVTPGQPDQSQLLLDASGGNSHIGGVRLEVGSTEYTTVADWIAMLPTAP